MSRLIFLLISVMFLNAKELVITKYLDYRPSIEIKFNGNRNVLRILKTDLQVLDHFNYTINTDKNCSYTFKFNYSDKNLKVSYFNKGKLLKSIIYKSNSSYYYPFLIHKAVYDINEFFSLPSAKFLIRKVVYSLSTAPKQTNIYLADYTLSYKKLIISGGLNIFPKWANNRYQNEIFYTSLGREAVLYKLNLKTGKREKLLSSQGLLIVSDVKGDKLLVTLALNGSPDVYEFDLKTKKLTQITTYPGIDVNGKFWGEDKIVFVSDRYGIPMVFSKDLKTGAISRVVYHGKNQVGVDTYKKYLVLSSRESDKSFGNNTFNLFLVNKNDDSLKRLTFSGQNSFPNFSVDGNSIMFIKRENFYSKIGIIRLNENKVFYYPLPKILQSFDW